MNFDAIHAGNDPVSFIHITQFDYILRPDTGPNKWFIIKKCGLAPGFNAHNEPLDEHIREVQAAGPRLAQAESLLQNIVTIQGHEMLT